MQCCAAIASSARTRRRRLPRNGMRARGSTNAPSACARFAHFRRGAFVVNGARGALIVENDLIVQIDNGHWAGAMLDVFENEPLPPGHAFWHHPGITLTPHISAVTSIAQSVGQIAAKIGRLEAGLPISGVVDAARAY